MHNIPQTQNPEPMSEPHQLLQRSVSMSDPDDYDVNYDALINGNPEQVHEQFERWKYSHDQMVYVKNIPDEMTEDFLRELFFEYGWIKTFQLVRQDKTAIIQFSNIRRFDFADNIARCHPDTYPIVVQTNVMFCGLHVPDTEEKSVSQLIEMIKNIKEELTDRLMETNQRLVEAELNFAKSTDSMLQKIAELTDKINDMTILLNAQ